MSCITFREPLNGKHVVSWATRVYGLFHCSARLRGFDLKFFREAKVAERGGIATVGRIYSELSRGFGLICLILHTVNTQIFTCLNKSIYTHIISPYYLGKAYMDLRVGPLGNILRSHMTTPHKNKPNLSQVTFTIASSQSVTRHKRFNLRSFLLVVLTRSLKKCLRNCFT